MYVYLYTFIAFHAVNLYCLCAIIECKILTGKTLVNVVKQISFTNILPIQIPDSPIC